MRAGKLRHRLSIQRETEFVSPNGERSKVWTTAWTVWGSVEPLSAKESTSAQQQGGNVTHKITVRGARITTQDRVSYNGRIFHLESVLNFEERGIKTDALANEVV